MATDNRKRTRRKTPPAACQCGAMESAIIVFDVPNDQYFVSCCACGREGQRHESEKQCKYLWARREGIREAKDVAVSDFGAKESYDE